MLTRFKKFGGSGDKPTPLPGNPAGTNVTPMSSEKPAASAAAPVSSIPEPPAPPRMAALPTYTAIKVRLHHRLLEEINLSAIETMRRKFPNLDVILIESGGDNLAATFSPELADLTIYVIDVAQGEKIPRKGGPGITRSDLLVINKTDLAPHVGADLSIMESDTKRMRGEKPYVFTNIRAGTGVEDIARFIERMGGLATAA